MASLTLNLSIDFLPTYYALVDCAAEIAIRHGEYRASEWVQEVIVRDFDLFCRIATDSRPNLRLIQGGR